MSKLIVMVGVTAFLATFCCFIVHNIFNHARKKKNVSDLCI